MTNITVFAGILKDEPVGCKDAVLPKLRLKDHTVNCFTYDENTRQPKNDSLCFFIALALHLHGNERLEEETSKIFNPFFKRLDVLSPDWFKGNHMNKLPVVQGLLTLKVLHYDINIVDGELPGRSVQK